MKTSRNSRRVILNPGILIGGEGALNDDRISFGRPKADKA
jgi:hypothetical protein